MHQVFAIQNNTEEHSKRVTRTVALFCVLTPRAHSGRSGMAPPKPVALDGTRFTFWRPLSAMLSSD